MTREERHIAVLSRLLENMDVYDSIQPTTERKKAIKAAIQALSQEPCEDAVSREDAEQMLRNIRSHLKPQDYKSAEEFNTRDLMLLNAEQMIHALPSVTQKSGKWILLDECANSGYYCSRCQKKLVKEGWSDTVKKIKFCPNCGAKMESEG